MIKVWFMVCTGLGTKKTCQGSGKDLVLSLKKTALVATNTTGDHDFC